MAPASSSSSSSAFATTLDCDYLVVGAGTAGLSFCDTLLSEDPTAKMVVVDRNDRPGGHWNFAYPFCKLHQPSCFYGVNSVPLGKTRSRWWGKELHDIDDRATAREVLEYFDGVQRKMEATGRVTFVMGAEYRFEERRQAHMVVTKSPKNGTETIRTVVCHKKVVTVASNVTVPAMRKEPPFPVDPKANFVTVNELPEQVQSGHCTKYVVLGAGKTGVDALAYLFESGVDKANITWIVSRDGWYFVREFMADFYGMLDAYQRQIDSCHSVAEVFAGLERAGAMGRIDPGVVPEIYKGAVISRQELGWIRSIPHVVRMGRAKRIGADEIVLERGSLPYDHRTTLLVDATIDQWYGYAGYGPKFEIFAAPDKIQLGPTVMAGNFSFSSAYIAFLESRPTLDDAHKNRCCRFLRGSFAHPPDPVAALGMMYLQSKSLDEFFKLPGSLRFFFGSRTNMNAPPHHVGGYPRMLWNLAGPRQLYAFRTKLAAKIEAGGFSDVAHRFGLDTFAPSDRKDKNDGGGNGAAFATTSPA